VGVTSNDCVVRQNRRSAPINMGMVTR
jgi:hypothetical protein